LSTSANKGGQINFSVILVMDLIKHFWYLIHVEQQEETVTVLLPMSQMTPLKMIRTTLVSAIFRQFGSCSWTFSSPCQRQCELLPSLGVHRPSSVNFSHFNLLL
jgi:hypothetical protein